MKIYLCKLCKIIIGALKRKYVWYTFCHFQFLCYNLEIIDSNTGKCLLAGVRLHSGTGSLEHLVAPFPPLKYSTEHSILLDVRIRHSSHNTQVPITINIKIICWHIVLSTVIVRYNFCFPRCMLSMILLDTVSVSQYLDHIHTCLSQ